MYNTLITTRGISRKFSVACHCPQRVFPAIGEFPFLAKLMGNTRSMSGRGDETDSSDDEIDLRYLRGNPNPPVEMNCELDAAITSVPVSSARPSCRFAIIASELTEYEKISLIFLLNDLPVDALNRMRRVLESGVPEFILPPSFSFDNARDRNSLIEALCVIQNFYILRKHFGKSKSDLIKQYKPYQRCCAVHINITKKCLYRLFEDMTSADSEAFLEAVRKNVQLPQFPYMEMYFTYLETIDFIGGANEFGNIEKALMYIDKDLFYSDLQSIYNRQGRQMNVDRARTPSITAETINFGNASAPSDRMLGAYRMDDDHPGIVVIIDNENFYSEPDDELKDQLLSSSKLSDRKGSKHDATCLEKSFKRFNFKVIKKNNQTHEDMLNYVRKVAHNEFQPEHSCIFICLMSHGIEGKVVGSNSIPVAIEDIKKQLHSPNLEGKPKVLIIQSCQGEEIQTLTTDSPNAEEIEVDQKLVTDAPTGRIPATADYLEIWSTVPGYASIRDIYNGTWFIQTLCQVLNRSNQGANMLEICTLTRKNLLDKKWEVQEKDKTQVRVMVCETRDTLLKKLLLPRVIDN